MYADEINVRGRRHSLRRRLHIFVTVLRPTHPSFTFYALSVHNSRRNIFPIVILIASRPQKRRGERNKNNNKKQQTTRHIYRAQICPARSINNRPAVAYRKHRGKRRCSLSKVSNGAQEMDFANLTGIEGACHVPWRFYRRRNPSGPGPKTVRDWLSRFRYQPNNGALIKFILRCDRKCLRHRDMMASVAHTKII